MVEAKVKARMDAEVKAQVETEVKAVKAQMDVELKAQMEADVKARVEAEERLKGKALDEPEVSQCPETQYGANESEKGVEYQKPTLVQDIVNEDPTEAAGLSGGNNNVMEGKDLNVVDKPEVVLEAENGGWTQVRTRSKAQMKLDQNKGSTYPSSVPHG
ncbi:hypothetical protein RIF29_14753 [Crotalaria pallida]|uniref:Uncharacterized protein n=1 Tax=Crotalaria pallida TaxID=3830 RepID=A0AAN9FDY9_CROPI